MSIKRRELLWLAGSTWGCRSESGPEPAGGGLVRAVAFDAFVLFDPRPFWQALEREFPGRGGAVAEGFRTRLFEYGWLRVLGGRYEDFWALSQDALDAAASAQGVRLAAPVRTSLLREWAALPAWPDAVAGVRALADRGYALAVLSNWSPRMLDDALDRVGLRPSVLALSTDRVRSYKPDPRAYALAPEAFGLSRARIAFVAFAAWDAAGASWFGFRSVWMNRAKATPESLDAGPISMARSFADLASAAPFA